MPVSSVTNQQTILNTAAGIINAGTISDYYGVSWTVISTITISGDLEKAKSLVTGPPGSSSPTTPPTTPPTAPPTHPTTPPTVPPTHPTTPPTAPPTHPTTPPTVPPTNGLTCGLAGCVINNNWVEFVPYNGQQVTTPQVRCASGLVLSCTWSSTKYQCASSSAVCASPVPLINGVNCPLTLGSAAQSCSANGVTINNYWVEYLPPITNYSPTLATVNCADGRYISCVADGTKVQCNPGSSACLTPLPIYNGSPCPFPASILSDGSAVADTQEGMSPSVIIGLAVGFTLLAVLIIIGVFVFYKKRQSVSEVI